MTAPLSHIFDHLWQSTLFAAAIAVAALAFRPNRARVRHALWLAASLKFLVPFSLFVALGSHLHLRPSPTPQLSSLTVIVDTASRPFTLQSRLAPPKPTADPLPAILFAVWLSGFLAIASGWFLRWRRLSATVHGASPLNLDLPIPALGSDSLLEPGVFGIFRPILLLPAGIADRLTPAQLEAVLAHELLHIRYRDNLSAALHMLVETVFWFHPLVWWIGKRMLGERERACDEGVLGGAADPRVYAEAVLSVCKLYVESSLPCVSGITGADLKRRIEAIMRQHIVRDLSATRKLALAAAAFAAVALPIAVGVLHLPIVKAQSTAPAPSPVSAPQPPARQPAPAPTAIAAPEPPQDIDSANLTNRDMARVYKRYGRPDLYSRTFDPNAPIEIWRYKYLDDFRSAVEFQFRASVPAGMQINAPLPAARFDGNPAVAFSVLDRDQIPIAGLPGRHAFIGTYAAPTSHPDQYVNLTIPLDSFSGAIDIAGRIQSAAGTQIITTALVRDRLTVPSVPNPVYQSYFLLQPGSYLCQVDVRDAATGHTYEESISFDLK